MYSASAKVFCASAAVSNFAVTSSQLLSVQPCFSAVLNAATPSFQRLCASMFTVWPPPVLIALPPSPEAAAVLPPPEDDPAPAPPPQPAAATPIEASNKHARIMIGF